MAGSELSTGRVRFPALDPEPPPRPWWLRMLAAAGVLAVAATVAAVIVVWPFRSATGKPAAAGRRLPAGLDSGQILTVLPDGTLALASPDGTRVTRLQRVGAVGQSVSVSPGAHYLTGG